MQRLCTALCIANLILLISFFGFASQKSFADVPIPTVSLINGDTNGDDVIDDKDLINIINNFLNSPGSDLLTDLNGDGIVDDSDLLIVIKNFGAQAQTINEVNSRNGLGSGSCSSTLTFYVKLGDFTGDMSDYNVHIQAIQKDRSSPNYGQEVDFIQRLNPISPVNVEVPGGFYQVNVKPYFYYDPGVSIDIIPASWLTGSVHHDNYDYLFTSGIQRSPLNTKIGDGKIIMDHLTGCGTWLMFPPSSLCQESLSLSPVYGSFQTVTNWNTDLLTQDFNREFNVPNSDIVNKYSSIETNGLLPISDGLLLWIGKSSTQGALWHPVNSRLTGSHDPGWVKLKDDITLIEGTANTPVTSNHYTLWFYPTWYVGAMNNLSQVVKDIGNSADMKVLFATDSISSLAFSQSPSPLSVYIEPMDWHWKSVCLGSSLPSIQYIESNWWRKPHSSSANELALRYEGDIEPHKFYVSNITANLASSVDPRPICKGSPEEGDGYDPNSQPTFVRSQKYDLMSGFYVGQVKQYYGDRETTAQNQPDLSNAGRALVQFNLPSGFLADNADKTKFNSCLSLSYYASPRGVVSSLGTNSSNPLYGQAFRLFRMPDEILSWDAASVTWNIFGGFYEVNHSLLTTIPSLSASSRYIHYNVASTLEDDTPSPEFANYLDPELHYEPETIWKNGKLGMRLESLSNLAVDPSKKTSLIFNTAGQLPSNQKLGYILTVEDEKWPDEDFVAWYYFSRQTEGWMHPPLYWVIKWDN